ncbi:GTPase [Parachlamydia sp. AcF125]|uniref:GTPase n=1 Tax=Parachlamydia sp. AcF125 TaxID=2795736 RepID=UPI001BCA1521|nr:GTPase [Parachlamydia sp. AcF125]MBS4168142.1 hypothetical protein [Parachlamydia sp. AcF125]
MLPGITLTTAGSHPKVSEKKVEDAKLANQQTTVAAIADRTIIFFSHGYNQFTKLSPFSNKKTEKHPADLEAATSSGTIALSKEEGLEENPTKNFNKLASQIMQHARLLPEELGKIALEDLLISIESVFSKMLERELKKEQGQEYAMVIGNTGAGKSTFIGYLQGAKITFGKVTSETANTKRQVTMYAADYEDKENAGNYPKLGNFNSETKGAIAYGKYVDTAGFFDTAGSAEKLCNSVAIGMAASIYEPKRLIAVINSTAFEDTRAHGFLNLIKKIKRMVEEPVDENTLPSILFVVNDFLKNRRINHRSSQEEIEEEIARAIIGLEEDRDIILKRGGKDPIQVEKIFNKIKIIQKKLRGPQEGEAKIIGSSKEEVKQNSLMEEESEIIKQFEMIDSSEEVQVKSAEAEAEELKEVANLHEKGNCGKEVQEKSPGTKEFREIIKQLEEIEMRLEEAKASEGILKQFRETQKEFLSLLSPRVVEIQEEITLLKKVQELKNVRVVDIFQDDSREKMEEYLKKHPLSHPLAFNPSPSKDINFQKLKAGLSGIAAYFNSLYLKKKGYWIRLDINISFIADIEKHIELAEQRINSKSGNERDLISQTQSEYKDIQKQIEEAKKKQAELKKQIEELEKEKKDLSTNETVVFWKRIGQKVHTQSFWRRYFPKTYSFKQEGQTPIVEVKLRPEIGWGEKDGWEGGEFKVINGKELDKGKYEAIYTPRWYWYKQDRKAKAKLFAKTKDLPATLQTIQSINVQLAGLEAQQKEHENHLTDLENRLKDYEKGIGELIEKDKQRIEEDRKTLEQLKNVRKELEKELKKVDSNLATYHEFCQLIGKIVQQLKLNPSTEDSGKSRIDPAKGIFAQFLSNVNPSEEPLLES